MGNILKNLKFSHSKISLNALFRVYPVKYCTLISLVL